MELLSILLGLTSGAIFTVLISRWVPTYFASLTAPLCHVRRPDGQRWESPHSLIPQTVHLLGIYVMFSFTFAITGGSSFQLLTSAGRMDSQSLLPGAVAGLLMVAMTRVEAISHNTALASALQGLLITALGVVAFMAVSAPGRLTDISEGAFNAAPDLMPCICLSAILMVAVTEAPFALAQRFQLRGFRRIPYQLVRQRIEQWEMVEQLWAPWSVTRWTAQKIDDASKRPGIEAACWLTNTYPTGVLDALRNAGIVPSMGADPPLKIVLPRGEWQKFAAQVGGGSAVWRNCVRLLRHETRPRIRLLILSPAAAIVHLPIEHDAADAEESSNYAALVSDPARISEAQAWFAQIWRDSDPAPDGADQDGATNWTTVNTDQGC